MARIMKRTPKFCRVYSQFTEVFYNRKRRHGYLGNISPADFEQRTTGSF
jgi:transposase InsO family protein